MNWLKVDDIRQSKYMSLIENLVRPQETSCIDAVSVLSGTWKSSEPIIIHTDGNTADAALFFTSYGRVMPLLDSSFTFHQEDVDHISKLAGNAVVLPTSVSGRSEAVDMFLERFSCGQRQQIVEHYIM